jgi:hypothetical protein
MDKDVVIRMAVGIVSAVAGAIGTAVSITQVANIGFEWWPTIAWGIFAGMLIWTIRDLHRTNVRLLDHKPSLSVSADSINDMRYLKITNDGEEGVFSAQLSVIRAPGSSIGEEYDGIWNRTSTHESRLMHGQSDYIKVASVRATASESFLELYGFDGNSRSECIVRSIKVHESLQKGKIPQFEIQVSLFSNPSLRNGVFTKAYWVGLRGIFPSPHKNRKKLTTIPARYIEV